MKKKKEEEEEGEQKGEKEKLLSETTLHLVMHGSYLKISRTKF